MAAANSVAKRLLGSFKGVGLSIAQVRRLLPEWWEDAAADDPGGLLELQILLARRLNVEIDSLQRSTPTPSFHEGIRRFKTVHLEGSSQLLVASGLGFAIAQLLVDTIERPLEELGEASDVRAELVADEGAVTLSGLCAWLWSRGVPVIHMTGWPAGLRRPDAMCVRVGTRPVVMVVRKENATAKLAYLVAHELGHLVAGHLDREENMVLVDDSLPVDEEDAANDNDEKQADRFAMRLLGGRALTQAAQSLPAYLNAPLDIAVAALNASQGRGIDPGQVILGWGRLTSNWKATNGALRYLMTTEPAPVVINDIASSNANLSRLSNDNREHLEQLTGLGSATS